MLPLWTQQRLLGIAGSKYKILLDYSRPYLPSIPPSFPSLLRLSLPTAVSLSFHPSLPPSQTSTALPLQLRIPDNLTVQEIHVTLGRGRKKNNISVIVIYGVHDNLIVRASNL